MKYARIDNVLRGEPILVMGWWLYADVSATIVLQKDPFTATNKLGESSDFAANGLEVDAIEIGDILVVNSYGTMLKLEKPLTEDLRNAFKREACRLVLKRCEGNIVWEDDED